MSFLDDMFGSNKVDFSGAEQGYSQDMQKIQDAIKAAESQGRTDIADSLRKSLALNQPYISAGNTAMSAWLNSLGIGDQGVKGQQSLRDQFMQGPGFQYAVQTAQNAAQRRAAATGQTMSGAETRALADVAQGEASQDWGNWINNYQSQLGRIAGIGQGSAQQQAGLETQGGFNLANLGLNYANMSTKYMSDEAKARAEAQMAQQIENAQSQNSWFSSLGSLIGGGAGYLFGGPAGGAAGYQMFGGGNSNQNYNWLRNL